MNQKVVPVLLTLLLLNCWATLFFRAQIVNAASGTIYVPTDYTSIQAAINAANSGDIIRVESGNYYESVLVNKSVAVIGDSPITTTVYGIISDSNVFHVTSDNVEVSKMTLRNTADDPAIQVSSGKNCTIRNNIIKNSYSGIRAQNCPNITIVDNTLDRLSINIYSAADGNVSGNIITDSEGYGLTLDNSSSINVQNNIISNGGGIKLKFSVYCNLEGNKLNESWAGITLDRTHFCTLYGNEVTDGYSGIEIDQSYGTELKNNVISGNYRNFGVFGYDKYDFRVDIDTSNTVNGNPIYYLANQSNLMITSSTHPAVGYLALINCTNMTVQGLTLSDNINGLLMALTTNSAIKQNTITQNGNGIWLLLHSDGNSIFDNNVQSNGAGVRAFYSDNNKIIANNMEQNSQSIWLDQSVNNEVFGNTINHYSYETMHLVNSSGNIIYSNNFLSNTYPNGWSSTINTWNKGYPGGGNYWISYEGVDLNSGISQGQLGSDGIGDVAYLFVDIYPLMAPVTTCEAGVWDGQTLYVELMTNSTISNFEVDKTGFFINFTASGNEDTVGFSRITVPNTIAQNLWGGVPAAILANGEAQEFRNWTDSENTYLYITYVHPADEIKLIPDFPSSVFLYLLILMTTLIVIIKKRTILQPKKS